MSTIALPLAAALVSGCVHALEADHMAAVTTFVSRRPHPARAFGFGLRWGLGHSLALLFAGGALILLDLSPPQAALRLMEFAVGAMLLGLGLWVLCGTARASELPLPHEHVHEPAQHEPSGRGTGWVGAIHGLAGTGGFLALAPAAMLASPWLASAYLALFSVGTMLAMGLYALGAGLVFHRVGSRAPSLVRLLRAAAGIASAVVGCAWMLTAAASAVGP